MLTIRNIGEVKNMMMGHWRVVEIGESKRENWLKAPHYYITFSRGSHGAAVLIDRTENRLLKQYHIYICYENFDNIIETTSWSKEGLLDREEFFEMVIKNLDYEWNRNTNP